MLTVVTFLWFDPNGRHNHLFVYSADYVNRLRSMLERHLKQPHELVCVTDMPDGIDPRVHVVPQPHADVVLRDDVPGWFRRLVIFHPEAGAWLGTRILLMDLDCVILRDLDPLLEGAGDFKSWEPRLYHQAGRPYSRYNMSFVLLDAGARPQVWEQFDLDASPGQLAAASLAVDDQSWLTHVLGNGEPVWPWDGDIVSVRAVSDPGRARVVFFNGPRSPAMPLMQKEYPFIGEHWR
jgi:hypothetical protein